MVLQHNSEEISTMIIVITCQCSDHMSYAVISFISCFYSQVSILFLILNILVWSISLSRAYNYLCIYLSLVNRVWSILSGEGTVIVLRQ